MTFGEERWGPTILTLPEDVLYILLAYLDIQALCRFAQVCTRFHRVASQECVWAVIRKRFTLVSEIRHFSKSSKGSGSKNACAVATNWKNGRKKETRVVRHRVKQLPWLQFDENYLWCTFNNTVRCYTQRRDGTLKEVPSRALKWHQKDVGRFKLKDNLLVTGARDGSIASFSTDGSLLMTMENCHIGDVQAVDFHDNIIISGSRDASVKIWSMDPNQNEALRHSIPTHDRVWSLAYNPDGRSFTVGTAGLNDHLPPLKIWDAETAGLLAMLGCNYRHGAGVLDIQYEDPYTLITCGYDTIIRLWDTRVSHSECVLRFEEPFDSTIYCVKSDRGHAILAGTAQHGMTRLWDKRMNVPVQMYFAGKYSSPVYSVTFDPSHLYVALDQGIHMLDFSV